MIGGADSPAAPAIEAVTFDLGVEARARAEWTSVDDGWTNYRLMPWVKVNVDPLTLFVQPIFARSIDENGGASTIEQTGLDLLQASGQIDFQLSSKMTMAVRAGRSLQKLGSERLIGARYGTNVPRAFDGVDVNLHGERASLKLFKLWQVRPGLDAFDDESTSDGRLTGGYAVLPLDSISSTLDVYALRTHFEKARFGSVSTSERTTFGLRLDGHAAGWRWNWEAMAQHGETSTGDIRAWSIASETARNLALFGKIAAVQLRANIASGGGSKTGTLRNFDPLFPKAKYFGELTPIGPSNMFNLHPSLITSLSSDVQLSLSAVAYWRFDRKEPAYSLSGRPIDFPAGKGKWIGGQLELTAEAKLTKGVDGLVSLSRFKASDDLRRFGSLQSTTLAAVELSFDL